MKIISLVENTTRTELKARHGLSLYIETKSHKILFDLGPDNTLFENANIKGIDISKIDVVVISHGHIDHGGALKRFLKINSSAKIYVQRNAFEPHYSRFLLFRIPIGIDKKFIHNKQIILLDGDYKIDDKISLFRITNTNILNIPTTNKTLYDKHGKDTFKHEQNMIISEDKTILIIGCGHCGVINIMKKAEKYQPSLCIGGFHLFNPFTKKTVSTDFLNNIATKLKEYNNTEFYTCHCTGKEAFKYLSQQMKNIHYISCGEEIEL